MARPVQIDYDPFSTQGSKSQGFRPIPVDHDPFSTEGSAPEKSGTGYDPYKDVKILGRAAFNLPGSVYKLARDTVSTLTKDPVDVLKGVYDVYAGGVEKGLSKLGVSGKGAHEQSFDAFVQHYVDKYGSLENVRKTFEQDPASFLADAGIVFGGAGGAIQKAGEAAKLGKVAKIGKGLKETGVSVGASPFTGPVKAAKETATAVAKALPETGYFSPEHLYGGAVKMPLSKKWVKELPGEEVSARTKAIRTGLEEGILPNDLGLKKLSNRIDETNKSIDAVIKGGAEKGETISTASIIKPLEALEKEYSIMPDVGSGHHTVSYAEEVKNLREATIKKYGDSIPIDKAQELKQLLYKINKKHYGEIKGITIESQKALARGIKDEIFKAHPELATLNKKDSALLKLDEALEKAVPRIQNRDVASLGYKAMGGGIKGIAAEVLDFPTIKARVAILLNKAKKSGTGTKALSSGNTAGKNLSLTAEQASMLDQRQKAILNAAELTDTDKQRFLENLNKEYESKDLGLRDFVRNIRKVRDSKVESAIVDHLSEKYASKTGMDRDIHLTAEEAQIILNKHPELSPDELLRIPETTRTANAVIYFPEKEKINFIKYLQGKDKYRVTSVGKVEGKAGTRVFSNFDTPEGSKGANYVSNLKKKGKDISE